MFQHYQTPAGCAEARFRNAARTAHQLRAIAFVSLLRRATQAATGLIGGFGRTVTGDGHQSLGLRPGAATDSDQ